MSKRIFNLVHDAARANALDCIAKAPDGYCVTVQEPKRNLAQNAAIHAALTDLGRAIGWKFNGVQVDIEDLKSVFMAAFRKVKGQESRFVIGLDGQPVILNWRTRELSKADAGEFIEMVQAYAAQVQA